MEEIIQILIKQGPLAAALVGIIILIVWWVLRQEKRHDKVTDKLNGKIEQFSNDYKNIADKSLSILILVDHKLNKESISNEDIKDILRLDKEILLRLQEALEILRRNQ